MTTERRLPETPEEILLDVLHGLELVGATTNKMGATADKMLVGIDAQTGNIDTLAKAIAKRPTNTALILVLAAMVVFQGILWIKTNTGQEYIKDQVRRGSQNQAEIICKLLNDPRSYHATDPVSPLCVTTTTRPLNR